MRSLDYAAIPVEISYNPGMARLTAHRIACHFIVALFVAAVRLGSPARADEVSTLTADNLVLIVNKNEPAGQRLASFYAEQRKVPAGRTLVLDLPKAEEISHHDYNTRVVPAVRSFLKENKLQQQATCLVTFFGVPLRVGPRTNSPEEAAEYRVVEQLLKDATAKSVQAVGNIEEVATQARPEFAPANKSNDLPALPQRADAAIKAAIAALPSDGDADRRAQRFSRLMAAVELLYGPLETQERLALPDYQKLAPKPISPEDRTASQQRTAQLIAQVKELGPKATKDPAVRAQLRELFATNLGTLRTLQVLLEQKLRLETRETEAAFDSELACLWWPDAYLRYRWHDNPLNHRIRFGPSQPAGSIPQTLMVMRLDAPTEQIVHDLISTSIQVEKEGLSGIFAIDARGRQPTDAYGRFDDTLRETSSEFKTRSKLEVRLDDSEPVFTPGAVQNVALYCGWYSLRNYVPGMAFNRGAVAYHVASGEMISLHNPNEKGWSANLLKAGAVATIGPVSEPYLHAFPLPSEFFPLLATGKLKLAEVYWLSNPLVSWMNACVGDPLYTPYAKSPPMKDIDVSHRLRAIFATTQPSE